MYAIRSYYDVLGVELAVAMKNVIAIAAGIADGLGMGHNARAAIITRGLAEISRLAVRRGANPLTLSGLSGMGVITSYSIHYTKLYEIASTFFMLFVLF